MRLLYISLILIGTIGQLVGQGLADTLKSSRFGMELMYGTIGYNKELVINHTRFSDGIDRKVDILRFDNVGETIGGDGPFVISSKEPVWSDSLGLTPLRLHPDTLKRLLKLIETLDTKNHVLLRDDIQFRMTYRFEGKINQYFIGEPKKSTQFFKAIEQRIKKMDNKEALEKFYHFLWSSSLLKKSNSPYLTYSPRGPIEWAY